VVRRLILLGIVGVAAMLAISLLVDNVEATCKKHKQCHEPKPTATAVVTPEPDDEIDSCFFHPTNPCTEATTVPSTPTATATAQPPVYDAFILTPPVEATVQLPPSGVLPGPPNTGSAGLKMETYTPSADCWYYISGRFFYLPCGSLGTTKTYLK
jgi:hypothetical protein